MRLYQIVSGAFESPGHSYTATLREAQTIARAAVGCARNPAEAEAEIYRLEFETTREGLLAVLNAEDFRIRELVQTVKSKGK